MHFNFPHKTSVAAAKSKITSILAEHAAEIAQHAKITKQEWEGDTMHFAVDLQGKNITGTLAVTDNEYVLDAQLPLLWRMFEGRIEKEVYKQLEQMK